LLEISPQPGGEIALTGLELLGSPRPPGDPFVHPCPLSVALSGGVCEHALLSFSS
jgi:hypothetical protein